jgi:hypothetical protein
MIREIPADAVFRVGCSVTGIWAAVDWISVSRGGLNGLVALSDFGRDRRLRFHANL